MCFTSHRLCDLRIILVIVWFTFFGVLCSGKLWYFSFPMESQFKMAMCNLWLVMMLQFIPLIDCTELQALKANDMRCMLEDREACKTAKGSHCEWCELPQGCYHIDLVKRLGSSCNGTERRQLKEVQDCGDIASEEKCLSFDHCRWCRSDVIYDGCFRAWEARRLPVQVFDCSKVS